jgi:hypothetical protein
MFGNNTLIVVNFSFPDVCKLPTPVGPIPIPLVNISISITHVPTALRTFVGIGFAENILTMGTVSNGDEAGCALGLISQLIVGPDRYYTCSFKVFFGAAPATRLTSITGQNGLLPNCIGISLVPGQFRVLLLG